MKGQLPCVLMGVILCIDLCPNEENIKQYTNQGNKRKEFLSLGYFFSMKDV